MYHCSWLLDKGTLWDRIGCGNVFVNQYVFQLKIVLYGLMCIHRSFLNFLWDYIFLFWSQWTLLPIAFQVSPFLVNSHFLPSSYLSNVFWRSLFTPFWRVILSSSFLLSKSKVSKWKSIASYFTQQTIAKKRRLF